MPPAKPTFTPRERELAVLMRRRPGASQADLARVLGISRQAVSTHLKNMIRKYRAAS